MLVVTMFKGGLDEACESSNIFDGSEVLGGFAGGEAGGEEISARPVERARWPVWRLMPTFAWYSLRMLDGEGGICWRSCSRSACKFLMEPLEVRGPMER